MVTKNKPWYMSKTKWGALLVGVGVVLGTAGKIVNGSLDLNPGILTLLTEIGVVLGVFGIRDLPLLNSKK